MARTLLLVVLLLIGTWYFWPEPRDNVNCEGRPGCEMHFFQDDTRQTKVGEYHKFCDGKSSQTGVKTPHFTSYQLACHQLNRDIE